MRKLCSNSAMVSRRRCAGFLLALSMALLLAAPAMRAADGAEATLPAVAVNDNRGAGGTLKNGVLAIQLELREARWYPDKDGGPSVVVQAFREEGRAPQIPGPMIRVPEGTEIHANVHNLLATSATVHGLHARPGDAKDAFELAPGQVREVRFLAGAPGTYYYWARTTKKEDPAPEETQLSGAFLVDPAGQAPDDRVFVIGLWYEPDIREVLTVNGKSFPYSERLTYTLGETARWRWINASESDHAMHLHGFFFKVNSAGNAERDTIYSESQRREAVTEHMDSGGT